MVSLNLPALRSFLWGAKVNQALTDLNAAKLEEAEVTAIADERAEAKFAEVVAAPNDAVVASLVETPASATATALASTFVRFLDENGDPLAGKLVTITVNSATGEIDDITSEDI